MVLMSFSVRLFFISSTHRSVSKYFYAGEVVEGMDIVKKIEGYGSQSGKTSKVIKIANCGTV